MVVVHCNHGKGRTGTIIISVMLFVGMFDNPKKALEYYAVKRFNKEGKGVTQPCQVRYIHYFDTALKKGLQLPSLKKLISIQTNGLSKNKISLFQAFSVRDKRLLASSVSISRGQILSQFKMETQHPLIGDIILKI